MVQIKHCVTRSSLAKAFPTKYQHLFHYFLGPFLEGSTDKSENDAPPKEVWVSASLIALSSYGEGRGDEGFWKQVYQTLRRPPFRSTISSEEQG